MFATTAQAQTPGAPAGAPAGGMGDLLQSPIIMMVGMVVLFYFLILRPQQKRVKAHQELVKNVRRGDTVITSGGIVAKVTKVVDDEQIEIELADGVRARQIRSMISEVRAKGEPVNDNTAAKS